MNPQNRNPQGKTISTRQKRQPFTRQSQTAAKKGTNPWPYPRDVVIQQFSIANGITFSVPVSCTGGAQEGIYVQIPGGTTAPNLVASAPSRVIQISGWSNGVPGPGSAWISLGYNNLLTPPPPYTEIQDWMGVTVP